MCISVNLKNDILCPHLFPFFVYIQSSSSKAKALRDVEGGVISRSFISSSSSSALVSSLELLSSSVS